MYAVPDADNTDLFGWKPYNPPPIDPFPPGWKLYTIIHGRILSPSPPQTAGWGVAVYSSSDLTNTQCLRTLYAPVCLDQEDQGFLGAEQASNNTGELTAIAEALLRMPRPTRYPCRNYLRLPIYAADLTSESQNPMLTTPCPNSVTSSTAPSVAPVPSPSDGSRVIL